ncbi:MAG: hypothetical protein ACUVTG_09645 [Candidatus Oleimicrobiaceae bacterium]
MRRAAVLATAAVLCTLLAVGGYAGERGSSGPRIGTHLGSFKPNCLATQPSVSPFDEEAARPWSGLLLATRAFSGTSLRLGVGCWSKGGEEPITLVPVALDVEHELVPGLPVKPYVAYGVAAYWGWTVGWRHLAGQPPTARGYGATLGVGLHLSLARHWTASTEFDLLFVKLRRPLAGHDDFSGPRLSVGLLYLF